VACATVKEQQMAKRSFIDRTSDFGVRIIKKVYIDAPKAAFKKGKK
jgi:hypothetical protein